MLRIPNSSYIMYHPFLSQPFLSLGLVTLSLLLLILILLSVPGPIKGLYWFSIKTEDGQNLNAGVMGWCMSDTSNCTYAPLSDNTYLSTLIDTGEALLVKTILPLTCYWMILTFFLWITLTALLFSFGYKIKNLDSIKQHLRFAIIESFIICFSIFGNVLSWLSLGFMQSAFKSIKNSGGKPKSGNVMTTTAITSFISLLSLIFAIWGLHLRLRSAQLQWKEQAIMVRRRSMALTAAGLVNPDQADLMGVKEESKLEKRLSVTSDSSSDYPKRDSTFKLVQAGINPGFNGQGDNRRSSSVNSMYKASYQPHARSNSGHSEEMVEEEHEELDNIDRDNQEMMRRVVSQDSPYTAARGFAN
ncbi:uncharacterized protein I206_100192 [Kwoniella pini CBS 10737]|uniref:Uncharacterized protein n=1 Tax=Kwoniella pini CBS 10737 TaxID=1296096 RepID=A0A1B9IE49_9TREE|nr:uncharacterized protein I206_01133 [Kwoniella pini CBS 10737]OCF53826.1 hypothetical protein I206_01133 [Kwoniella pini CBS 10737]